MSHWQKVAGSSLSVIAAAKVWKEFGPRYYIASGVGDDRIIRLPTHPVFCEQFLINEIGKCYVAASEKPGHVTVRRVD